MSAISVRYSYACTPVEMVLERRSRGGEAMGPRPLKFIRSHRIFRNCKVSSETFWNLAVGKDKGFEFYRKVFELGPPLLYRYHKASEMVALHYCCTMPVPFDKS